MRTLIAVDIQNDFFPGGALAVPGAEEILPVIDRIQDRFERVLAVADWHPIGHVSFASAHPGRKTGDVILSEGVEQVLWPDHCVQNTSTSAFHAGFRTDRIESIFHKGTDKKIDSYSCFFDNRHLRSTGLEDYLRRRKVTEIYLAGLALDYCVKYSALDAVRLGFRTFVIMDACRAIQTGTKDKEMLAAELAGSGTILVRSEDLLFHPA